MSVVLEKPVDRVFQWLDHQLAQPNFAQCTE
jgi:hypothetical protein